MIGSGFSAVTGFIYEITIGTVQHSRKSNADISGFGLSKMIAKASAIALLTGLVSSRISIPPTIPMIIGGLAFFSRQAKAYNDDQFFKDWHQQKNYVEKYPSLGKIFQKQFSEF